MGDTDSGDIRNGLDREERGSKAMIEGSIALLSSSLMLKKKHATTLVLLGKSLESLVLECV